MNEIRVVNLAEKFGEFSQHWSPKVVGTVNNFHVRLVKLQGEFVWHHHEHEDELFLVIQGRLLIKLRDRDLWIDEGEFVIIPKGVEHLPIAESEVQVMLFEQDTTLNTGSVENERTVRDLDRL
jgi:mannose-6-phosphate isomerase-like protein (cupin superfamily)